MGRASTKENKSIYQQKREELGLTREKAAEFLPGVSPERIEKLENGKTQVHPEDVVILADGYKDPHLCNYYCSNECPIGQRYVPEIKMQDLSQIVLEMTVSLNSLQKDQERFLEIAVDQQISNDELQDFVRIQEQLERMSMSVESLQLWAEHMLASGNIDRDAYEAVKAERANS